MAKKKVGLVGCGTIGSQLAITLDSDKIANASLVAIFDIAVSNLQNLKSKLHGSTGAYSDFETSEIKLDSITKSTAIYEGTAAEAVRKFPANVNVAAVLSLAGIGVDKTRVKIVADPQATMNQHEIVAAGSFGEIIVRVNNVQ